MFNYYYHKWPEGGTGTSCIDIVFLITSLWRDLVKQDFLEKYRNDLQSMPPNQILFSVIFFAKY